MNGFAVTALPAFRTAYIQNALPRLSLCDIGFNIGDEMFRGKYHDKQVHDDDLHMILQRARTMGTVSSLCTSSNAAEARENIATCRDSRWNSILRLRCTAGIHPCRATEFEKGTSSVIAELDDVLGEGTSDGTVVALGELGLDYDRFHYCGKELQLIGFQAQLGLAAKYNLPVFLHNRNTDGDFVRIMKENIHLLPAGGVVHSYTDSLEEMEELTKLGLYIGVNGCSIRTEESIKVVEQIPADRLLLETDAPWCSIKSTHPMHSSLTTTFPVVKKEKFAMGKMIKDRNEPCALIQVLEAVAIIRKVDPIDLAQQVHDNTKRLFPSLFE